MPHRPTGFADHPLRRWAGLAAFGDYKSLQSIASPAGRPNHTGPAHLFVVDEWPLDFGINSFHRGPAGARAPGPWRSAASRCSYSRRLDTAERRTARTSGAGHERVRRMSWSVTPFGCKTQRACAWGSFLAARIGRRCAAGRVHGHAARGVRPRPGRPALRGRDRRQPGRPADRALRYAGTDAGNDPYEVSRSGGVATSPG